LRKRKLLKNKKNHPLPEEGLVQEKGKNNPMAKKFWKRGGEERENGRGGGRDDICQRNPIKRGGTFGQEVRLRTKKKVQNSQEKKRGPTWKGEKALGGEVVTYRGVKINRDLHSRRREREGGILIKKGEGVKQSLGRGKCMKGPIHQA